MPDSHSAPLRLGLTGYPLGHSFSPVLHQAALRGCGLEGRYDLYPLAPGDTAALKALVSRLRSSDRLHSSVLHGLNVTIPHKQAVLPLVDTLTPPARAIGAVNTLFMDNGLLIGDNTDAPGFLADLTLHNVSLPGEALILGAGGAARAVVYALQTAGWRVSLAARRREQSAALQADFPGLAVRSLTAAGLADWQPDGEGLIVNASAAGMSPAVDGTPWPSGLPFPGRVFVYDLVYNPAETALLKAARRAGLSGCSGLGMLVEQAALAFQRWTDSLGLAPSCSPRLAMRQAVKIE